MDFMNLPVLHFVWKSAKKDLHNVSREQVCESTELVKAVEILVSGSCSDSISRSSKLPVVFLYSG